MFLEAICLCLSPFLVYMYEQSKNHISLIKQAQMLCKVTYCAGRISANTRPHQLRWGDREMGTAISCTECSQVAGLIQKLVETPRKHRLFVQLFFVQLSFVQRSCVCMTWFSSLKSVYMLTAAVLLSGSQVVQMLVITGVPFLIIIRPGVLVPLNSRPITHYRKGRTTPPHLKLF